MMNRIACKILAAPAVAAGLILAQGCGGGAPPVDTSTAQATVSGKVTIRGKPATKGSINFDPSNIKRKDAAPTTAAIGPDGSYTAKTLLGVNQVTFSGPPFVKDPALQDSQFQFDVQAGENTFNPDLPPKVGP
ncbi:hypothetical protein TA3x_002885 [Tundrisphaera sp. TA3]|uniref:hypothetical protein n=1 Tax=Tundrisphaera sp. TA3 TaxID=3435775 RepID=UPI003EBC9B0B